MSFTEARVNTTAAQKIILENSVKIIVEKNHDNPTKSKTFYNPVMKICRELVLSAVSAFTGETGKVITLLDAFGATGISGLLWRHHTAESDTAQVRVTVNDVDSSAVTAIKANCELNRVPFQFRSSPEIGQVDRADNQKEDLAANGDCCDRGIEITQCDANVLMHQRQFDFIHLDPYGCAAQYLDAAFRNVYNNGIIVVTSTDLASVFGKVPQVTLRNYGAFITRTEYMKELAARIVLGAVARSAAKCNKGIEVLYSVSVEHFVQVAVRVRRGAAHADKCASSVRRVLHCQMCEERVFYPHTNIPIDNVYELLPCDCHQKNPGQTGIELGPVWCDSLFCASFLRRMVTSCTDMKLSGKAHSLINQMIEEAVCSPIPNVILISKNKPDRPEKQNTVKADDQVIAFDKTVLKDGNIDDSNDLKKRKTDLDCEAPVKRTKLDDDESNAQQVEPPFYYDIHKQKMKISSLPKAQHLVVMLQKAGYRASRTHFCPTSVRTNANLRQLKDALMKRCEKT